MRNFIFTLFLYILSSCILTGLHTQTAKAGTEVTIPWSVAIADNDITITMFSYTDISFGIYDWGTDHSSGINLVSGSGILVGSANVTMSGGDYFIDGYNIGDTPEIGLYFHTSGGGYDIDYTYVPAGDGYSLETSIEGLAALTVDDIRPVPLPGAWIILASGLVGLVGFKRRSTD